MKFLVLFGFIINLLASCVSPTPIVPPDAQLPASYRGVASPAPSLATLTYRQLYGDSVLQGLIAQALEHNVNVEQAYQSIVAAQANVNIHAGQQQVQVNASVGAPYSTSVGQTPYILYGSSSGNNGTGAHILFQPSLGVGVSYEFDFFGRLSSATRQARAQLLSSIEARDAIVWQLVSSVATDYFTLRELDGELDIANSTLQARKLNLDLVNARFQGGVSDLQAVRQAEESYYQVSASIPQIQRSATLTEDAIATLTGSYPKDIPRGLPLDQQVTLPEVPPTGVPSGLLERRPDIMQAEANLAAASANVDIARALLYPQVTLGVDASGGFTAINSAFYGPAGLFSIVPQLLAPIFNGGSLKANVQLTQAQREQIAYTYLGSVQKAMQEVADAVASYSRLREFSAQTDLQTAASVDSLRLANLRYQGGVTSYLEVLDSETRSYQDELAALQAHLDERLALVQLYLALGGGWQQTGS